MYPAFASHVIGISGRKGETLGVDGHYLQRAVLKFQMDESSTQFVNHLLKREGVDSIRAVRLVRFRFETRTEVLSVPLGRTTRMAYLAIEMERLADRTRYTSEIRIDIDVPPAHVFLAPATTERGIDDEMLGSIMSEFVAGVFRDAAVQLVEEAKEPNQALQTTPVTRSEI